MDTWILLVLFSLLSFVSLLLYLFHIEIPRLQSLLDEIRTQHASRPVHPMKNEDDGQVHEETDKESEAIEFHAQKGERGTTAEDLFASSTVQLDIEELSADGSTYSNETGVAEVITMKGKSDPKKPLFLIIPGNPGLVGFYRLFMLYLSRLSKNQVEFRCVSYVGHTAGNWNKNRVFDFPFQLKFFRKYIQTVVAEHPSRKIFLSGHSVGAYVCLQMLDALPLEQSSRLIPQTFMLCPTVVDIANTPNGFTHTPVLKYARWLVAGIVGVISFLPQHLREYLVARHVGLHPWEVETAYSILQLSTIRNCLNMANGEMQMIKSLDVKLAEKHMDRCWWIWAWKDAWAPLSQRDYLAKTFGDKFHLEMAQKEVAHAFVVGGSHLVAPLVWRRLKKFL